MSNYTFFATQRDMSQALISVKEFSIVHLVRGMCTILLHLFGPLRGRNFYEQEWSGVGKPIDPEAYGRARNHGGYVGRNTYDNHYNPLNSGQFLGGGIHTFMEMAMFVSDYAQDLTLHLKRYANDASIYMPMLVNMDEYSNDVSYINRTLREFGLWKEKALAAEREAMGSPHWGTATGYSKWDPAKIANELEAARREVDLAIEKRRAEYAAEQTKRDLPPVEKPVDCEHVNNENSIPFDGGSNG